VAIKKDARLGHSRLGILVDVSIGYVEVNRRRFDQLPK